MTDNTFATLGLTIVLAMSDNPYFENPVPTLDDVGLRVDEFESKLANASKGSPLDTSEKNNSRKLLEEELKKLAFYVNGVARGALALHIVLSSGFTVSALAIRREIPEVPERLRLGDTPQSGQLRLDFSPTKGAWEYEYTYATELAQEGEPLWGK